MKRLNDRKTNAAKIPVWLDMLYRDFSHHQPLEVLDFTGFRLTDDVLRKCLKAEGVRANLRSVRVR